MEAKLRDIQWPRVPLAEVRAEREKYEMLYPGVQLQEKVYGREVMEVE